MRVSDMRDESKSLLTWYGLGLYLHEYVNQSGRLRLFILYIYSFQIFIVQMLCKKKTSMESNN